MIHYIFSYNRYRSLSKLVQLLQKYFPDDEIYIFDSGRRDGLLSYLNRSCNGQLKIFQTEAKDLFENIISALNVIDSPGIYYHDDDTINVDQIYSLKKYISHNVDAIISMKNLSADKFQYTYDNSNQKVKLMLESYLLSPDNDCPLISGIYIRDPQKMRLLLENSMGIAGKYSDVCFMCNLTEELLHVKFTNYILYNEHDGNDNATRCLLDRDKLSKYISSRPGFEYKIMSRLVYFGYKGRVLSFIFGLAMTVFYPSYFFLLVKKALYRYRLL